MQTIDPNEKLFLFGYSCKIFRDDEKAKYIDQGKHLIPWMGDDSVMIDRYDARGHLHDLKPYEPVPDLNYEEPNAEEEKLCDEERYRSLHSDLSEEQLYQEEELKRLRAAIAGDGAYCEIGFSYDNEVANFDEPVGPKVEEPEDEPFEAPEGLKIPNGMEEVPSNMKIHTIIEKTAMFVSEQGGQMEIIIKMKQQNNPQFGFMHLDNPLYPYYKFLVKEIKSGAYKPVQTKKVSQSEDEDDDGHYLHPSLLSGKKDNVPQFTVPSINFRRSQDDSYSVLVRNLQQQLAEEKQLREEAMKAAENASESMKLVNYSLNESQLSNSSLNHSYIGMIIPPPEIQPIIQKMAEYVAKNGEDFEYVVKSKKDKRFEFLQPTSEYYAYYIQLRNDSKEQLQTLPVSDENSAPYYNEQIARTEAYFEESNNVMGLQNDNTTPAVEVLEHKPTAQPMDEFDALYVQDSQDVMFGPHLHNPDISVEEHSNSVDSFDSVGAPKDSKSKTSKLKGPISFSLKSKDPDTVPTEKLKIPLLLDDSEEDSNEDPSKERGDREKKRGKSTEDYYHSASNSRHDSLEREEKMKLTSEMEAKLAEERIKDKLLSAARERLVQQKKERRLEMERQKREEQLKKEKQQQIELQRKEKQLQLERKKKAALFLKMLKKRNPELDTIEGRLGAEKKSKADKTNKELWDSGDASENGFPGAKRRIKAGGMALPGIKAEWSESSASEESGEEIMITEFCSDPNQPPEATPVPAPTAEPEKVPEAIKNEAKKKKKKHSRSRSQERHPKSYRSRDRRRSRSPRNYKHEKSKKEKELPAAYALVRPRSRSRSPRRYRQNPYWNRRR